MDLILAFVLGGLCGVFCTALIARKPEDGYDDYYDHDVSGLLEED